MSRVSRISLIIHFRPREFLFGVKYVVNYVNTHKHFQWVTMSFYLPLIETMLVINTERDFTVKEEVLY